MARAYRELVAAGVIETRGYLGTFVACASPNESALVDAAHSYVRLARALGVRKADALHYAAAAFGAGCARPGCCSPNGADHVDDPGHRGG